MGSFSMDFTGTPFVVNQDVIWKWQGSFANGDNSMGKALIDDKRKSITKVVKISMDHKLC